MEGKTFYHPKGTCIQWFLDGINGAKNVFTGGQIVQEKRMVVVMSAGTGRIDLKRLRWSVTKSLGLVAVYPEERCTRQ